MQIECPHGVDSVTDFDSSMCVNHIGFERKFIIELQYKNGINCCLRTICFWYGKLFIAPTAQIVWHFWGVCIEYPFPSFFLVFRFEIESEFQIAFFFGVEIKLSKIAVIENNLVNIICWCCPRFYGADRDCRLANVSEFELKCTLLYCLCTWMKLAVSVCNFSVPAFSVVRFACKMLDACVFAMNFCAFCMIIENKRKNLAQQHNEIMQSGCIECNAKRATEKDRPSQCSPRETEKELMSESLSERERDGKLWNSVKLVTNRIKKKKPCKSYYGCVVGSLFI